MLPHHQPLLAINISLVTNNKLNYGSVLLLTTGLLMAVLFGVHLCMSGVGLLSSAGSMRKVAGGLALLVGGLFMVGAIGVAYWEYTQLIDYV